MQFDTLLKGGHLIDPKNNIDAPMDLAISDGKVAAVDEDLIAAFRAAHEGDPLSAFGGIVAVNRTVDLALAAEIADPKKFLEVIVAPASAQLGEGEPRSSLYCAMLRAIYIYIYFAR